VRKQRLVWRPRQSVYPKPPVSQSVSQSIPALLSAADAFLKFLKFDTEVVHKNMSNKPQFCANRSSDSWTSRCE